MKRIFKALLELTKAFQDLPHPRRQAEELLCDLLACSRWQLYDKKEQVLGEKEWLTCQLWVLHRLQGEPLAYLSGKVEFYGTLLEVTPAVLIPRPETEVLVDKIAASLKKQSLQGKVLWDICSGSGCIGIALKKAFPELSVYLSDQSAEAVALAARNAEANETKVTCLQGDLLAPFQGNKAHLVVCNPPYISEEEYTLLEKGVRDYEPRQALLAGKTGLEFYDRLSRELPSYLYSQAQVWLEIGYQQGEAVKQLFQRFPVWRSMRVENDWAGHHRFFFLENE